MLVALAERDVTRREGASTRSTPRCWRSSSRARGWRRATRRRRTLSDRAFRRTLEHASEGLAIVDRKIRHAHTGRVFPVAALRGSDAEVDATVLNEERPRSVIAVVTFHDDEGRPVSKSRSRRTRIEPGSERVVSIPVHVPTDARYYTVTPLDVEDYAVNYRFQ